MDKRSAVYRRVCAFFKLLFRLFLPIQVTGQEHVPQEGAFILCSNHLSNWDPFVLACALPRQLVFLAKKELFKVPVVGWFVRSMGAFPVDRGNADLAAMRKCMSVLREGHALCIFPQGHRYKADDRRHLENGASMIALRTRTPIVPVHISAPLRLFHRLTIDIGEPLTLEDLSGKTDADTLTTATARLTAAIWPDEAQQAD